MKTFLTFLALTLASCVTNPKVTVTAPDGTKTELSTGQNLMAEVDEQVSEVEGNGYHLRHMVKRQDATRVPIAIAQTVGTLGVTYIGYLDRLAQEVTARMAAGELTKREGARLLAAIESEKIAAGVRGAEVVNPNIALPLRK